MAPGHSRSKFFLICLHCHIVIGYVIQAMRNSVLDTNPFSGIPFSRLVSAKVGLVCSLGGRGLMRSKPFKRLARLATGAVLLLVVQWACAPSSAWAGCNHLVASPTDPERLSSRIELLILDLAGRTQPLPIPAFPRQCSGTWCSSQPAAPSVPAVMLDGRLDSWAWCTEISCLASTGSSFLSDETTALRPLQKGSAVFHPPRLLPPV
jgi:hypothetical protein